MDTTSRCCCTYCGGLDITEDSFKLVCLSCGTVLDDILFEASAQVSGVALSAKRMLVEEGDDDVHPPEEDSSSGGTIMQMQSSGPRPMMRRVQEKHVWSQSTHKDRMVFQLLSEMTCNMASSATLVQGCVIEDAKRVYLECNRKNIRGNKSAKLAACVYIALQNNGTPKPCNEVADMFGVASKDVARTIKKITNSGVHTVVVQEGVPAEHMTVSQLLNKTCSVLNVGDGAGNARYHAVLQSMLASARFNCTPPTLVGTCICFCKRDDAPLHDAVAAFLAISVSTIHKYVKVVDELSL